MKLQKLITALALGATLTAPALADQRDPLAGLEPLLTPQALFGGLVTESDVALLFAHVRAAMLAAAEGREPPPPPEALNRRIETAGEELRVRGTFIGLALSLAMERVVRDAVREFAQPAPRSND
jgi:hypothetical protein